MHGYNDVMRLEIEHRFGRDILQRLAIRAAMLEAHVPFRPMAAGQGALLGYSLPGPERGATALAISVRGNVLAVAAADGSVTLHDLASGKVLATLRGHKTAAGAMAFSPNGKHLATYSKDAVRLWNVPVGTPVENWTCQGKLPAEFRGLLAVTNDGKVSAAFVETGSTDLKGPPDGGLHWAEVKLHDFTTGKVRVLARRTTPSFIPGIGASFSLLALSPGGKTLVISSILPGGTLEVMIVDAATGTARHCPANWSPSQGEDRLALSTDGQTLLSANDKTIKVWDLATGKLRQEMKSVAGIAALSCDGPVTLATLGAKNIIHVWWDGFTLLSELKAQVPAARFGAHAYPQKLTAKDNGKALRPHRPDPARIKGMKDALDDMAAGKLRLTWQWQSLPPGLQDLATLQEQIYCDLLKKECGIETHVHNPLLALSEEGEVAMRAYNDIMTMEIEHRFGAGILARLSEKARELAAKRCQS
jgi:WD40 repeat protein